MNDELNQALHSALKAFAHLAFVLSGKDPAIAQALVSIGQSLTTSQSGDEAQSGSGAIASELGPAPHQPEPSAPPQAVASSLAADALQVSEPQASPVSPSSRPEKPLDLIVRRPAMGVHTNPAAASISRTVYSSDPRADVRTASDEAADKFDEDLALNQLGEELERKVSACAVAASLLKNPSDKGATEHRIRLINHGRAHTVFYWMLNPSTSSALTEEAALSTELAYREVWTALKRGRELVESQRLDSLECANVLDVVVEAVQRADALLQPYAQRGRDVHLDAVRDWALQQTPDLPEASRDAGFHIEANHTIDEALNAISLQAKFRREREGLFVRLSRACNALKGADPNRIELWKQIGVCVDELIARGIRNNAPKLRNPVSEILDTLPGEIDTSPDLAQVIVHAQDVLERLQQPEPTAEVREQSEEVLLTRQRLKQTCVVLIGGDMRPHLKQGLEVAFDLQELVWVSTRAHQSFREFEDAVKRPEVSVVCLAIRWSSHDFSSIEGVCDLYNKPLVRLPAGLNPNQVAHQIVLQVPHDIQFRSATQASA